MIVTLKRGARPRDVQAALTGLGLWTRALERVGEPAAFTILEHSAVVAPERIRQISGVDEVWMPHSAHPLVDAQPGWSAGVMLAAGPCSVESEAMIHTLAGWVARCGGTHLRGGAFKPRSSPYSFDGHGEEALRWMREAADANGLAVVTEALGEGHVELVARYADWIQVGARNMQNFALLHAIGRTGAEVLLKRNPGATVEEWLLAGEHLLAHGASRVVFCERGIRALGSTTRYLLDVSAIAQLKHVHGQAVVVDPSHASGRRDLILPLARAGMAAGADGVLVEVHPEPHHALSDGPQALSPESLLQLSGELGLPLSSPSWSRYDATPSR